MGPKSKSKGGKATRPKAASATKPVSTGTPVLSDNSSQADPTDDFAAELRQFDEEEVRRIREAPPMQQSAGEGDENSDFDGTYECSPMRSFASSSARSAKYHSSDSPDRSKDEPQKSQALQAPKVSDASRSSNEVGDDPQKTYITLLFISLQNRSCSTPKT